MERFTHTPQIEWTYRQVCDNNQDRLDPLRRSLQDYTNLALKWWCISAELTFVSDAESWTQEEE